jgi:putative beta-lysine N-acetyltransferase
MNDKIEKLSCGSVIQHGPYNDRIYLLKASNKDLYSLPSKLIGQAIKKGYGKIFVKVNEIQSLPFLSEKFIIEARIPGMYPKDREGLFLVYYLKQERKEEADRQLYEKNLQLAREKQDGKLRILNSRQFALRTCTEKDVPVMKEIYKTVFPTYPFPIHEERYLLKTMNENVDYFCVVSEGKIVALSSAEKDEENDYAEMTDFATLPEWRGNGLAVHLLNKMERSIKGEGYQTAFTIARSASAGMNITFAKAGYAYGGRLKNNTNISGKIESMNVWYKKL